MNTFATIEPAYTFRKVTYYTIRMDGEEQPLFLRFLNNHGGEEFKEDIAIIRAWLSKLGNELGAQERYFRPEGFRGGDARALPPPARYLETDCDLRLYCMRVNDNVVILFCGAKKTANTAQECDNVRPHFLLANQLTKVIDQALRDGDIRQVGRKLEFSPDLKLEL